MPHSKRFLIHPLCRYPALWAMLILTKEYRKRGSQRCVSARDSLEGDPLSTADAGVGLGGFRKQGRGGQNPLHTGETFAANMIEAPCHYRKLRSVIQRLSNDRGSFYTGAVLTTTLDSRELKFLIRQIDEYIQVTEFMIRKTATLDHGELALARNLRTKLSPGKQAEHRRRTLPKNPARRRVVRIDDEVRPPQDSPQ
jgi:hypothetical protein